MKRETLPGQKTDCMICRKHETHTHTPGICTGEFELATMMVMQEMVCQRFRSPFIYEDHVWRIRVNPILPEMLPTGMLLYAAATGIPLPTFFLCFTLEHRDEKFENKTWEERKEHART